MLPKLLYMMNLSSLPTCRYHLKTPLGRCITSSASWYSPMLSGQFWLAGPSLLRVTVWTVLVEVTRKDPQHVKKIIVKIISKRKSTRKILLIIDKSNLISFSSSILFDNLLITMAEQNWYEYNFRWGVGGQRSKRDEGQGNLTRN